MGGFCLRIEEFVFDIRFRGVVGDDDTNML